MDYIFELGFRFYEDPRDRFPVTQVPTGRNSPCHVVIHVMHESIPQDVLVFGVRPL